MKKEIKIINGNLFYNNIELQELAQKHGTPLKITFLDIIKERVLVLKNSFNKVIDDMNYQGSFIYLNANKANYEALEVCEAFKYGDGLETSSYYDLLYTKEIYKKFNEKNKFIVSNGYKQDDYINAIIQCFNEGYNIIDIIDSIDEYEKLKQSGLKLNVGIRIHLSSQYSEEHEIVKNDRFGVTEQEFNYLLDDIKNTNLVLSTIHFHQRGFDYEENKFLINIKKAFINYYVKAKKKYNTVCNFDIGGGTPLPEDSAFDYQAWAKLLLETIQEASTMNMISVPNIISENGKYSQKDSTINIYEVVTIKNTDEIPWYVVNGSLLIALPEHYALGEPILVTPINGLDKLTVKGRLAGITCDCDDIYFEKNGHIMLPNMEDTKKVFIGLIGTGSYQNSMNGKGGVHHCLLPEEKDLIIFTENGQVKSQVRKELQTIDDIIKILKL